MAILQVRKRRLRELFKTISRSHRLATKQECKPVLSVHQTREKLQEENQLRVLEGRGQDSGVWLRWKAVHRQLWGRQGAHLTPEHTQQQG